MSAAPASSIPHADVTAESTRRCTPPSENESGVTLITPITDGAGKRSSIAGRADISGYFRGWTGGGATWERSAGACAGRSRGAVVAGLAWQGAAILTPLLIRSAIDSGIVDGHTDALWWACGGVIVLGAVEAVGGAARHYFAIRNRARADAAVRDGIFRQALELDAHYHDRVGAGELISRASNDAELVARAFDAIGHTIGYLLTVIGASLILLAIDWHLALAVLAPLPFVSIGFGRYSRRYAKRTRVNQEQLGEATALVEETISGIRVVKGLGAGPALSARFRRRSDEVVRTALDVASVDAVFLPALEALPLIGLLVVLWYGSHLVLAGDITIGTFAAFNFYLALLVYPFRTLGQRVAHVPAGGGRGAESRRGAPSRAGRRRGGLAAKVPDRGARPLRGRPFLVRRRRAAGARRVHAGHPARHVAGARRRDRLRQVDGRGAARPVLRPRGRPRDDRRHRRARAAARRPATRASASSSRTRSCSATR